MNPRQFANRHDLIRLELVEDPVAAICVPEDSDRSVTTGAMNIGHANGFFVCVHGAVVRVSERASRENRNHHVIWVNEIPSSFFR